MADTWARAAADAIHLTPTQAVLYLSGGASQVFIQFFISHSSAFDFPIITLFLLAFGLLLVNQLGHRVVALCSWSFRYSPRSSGALLQEFHGPVTRQGRTRHLNKFFIYA